MLAFLLALQTVWPVATPDEFRAAESAAQFGDRIVMQPGEYVFAFPNAFRVDVPVTVTVAGGGRATIKCQISGPSVQCTQADEAVRFERLDFRPEPVFPLSSGGGLEVQPGAGSVWLTECTTEPGKELFPGLRIHSANVVIRGGQYVGPPPFEGTEMAPPDQPGIHAVDSVVVLQDVVVRGADGRDAGFAFSELSPYSSQVGAPAIRMTGSTVRLSDCELEGGAGGDGFYFFSGSGPSSCEPASPGGDALSFGAGAPSRGTLYASTLMPGDGGASNAACDPFPAPSGAYYGGPGLDAATIAFSSFERRLDVEPLVAAGSSTTITIRVPLYSGPVLLAVSPGAFVGLVPTSSGPTFIGPLFNLVPVPGALSYSLTANVGALPPGTPFRDFYLQGVLLVPGLALTPPASLTVE